jgi:hypothetical protein
MCMNCGCMEPNEEHGNPANITLEGLRKAAEANGQTLEESISNIDQTYRQEVGSQRLD